MTKLARHARILEIAAQEGGVSVTELARQMGTSLMTIRRDLEELAKGGKLRRTHGGGIPVEPDVARFHFSRKQHICSAQKRAIAREAASLVKPGMAVSLDTGTTTLAVARELSGIKGLTVLTSSLPVASVLHQRAECDLVLLGGAARRNSPDLVGPLTEDNLKRFRVNLAIMGADAITRDGSFANDTGVARICRAMAENAEGVVLVADSSKFGRTAFARCLGLDEIDHLITDDGCSPASEVWLREAVAEVTLVHPARPRTAGGEGEAPAAGADEQVSSGGGGNCAV